MRFAAWLVTFCAILDMVKGHSRWGILGQMIIASYFHWKADRQLKGKP